jgi:hemoglobin
MHPQNLDKACGVAERSLRHPGTDRPLIGRLTGAFYSCVRQDERFGPIFVQPIVREWEPHPEKMTDTLVEDNFAMRLGLFRPTARELCEPDVATVFIDRAERRPKPEASHALPLATVSRRADRDVPCTATTRFAELNCDRPCEATYSTSRPEEALT